ncbi:hypothetical protein [Pasteurella sp. PK-2025]|uniref:hypothetical protein n=1 Tax=unclassified Pasteurella TaxID=2621516 RepID=UPI003C71DE84
MSFKIFGCLSCVLLSLATHTHAFTVRISEDTVDQFKDEFTTMTEQPAQHTAENSNNVTYVNRLATRKLNPTTNAKDANALGNSIEFEVYEMNENKSSHTIFESGGGICYGFMRDNGVDVTDATTYYVQPATKEDYYTNIATAKVSAKNDPKDMQYVPVFYIHDPDLAKKVQAQERLHGKALADKNIQKHSKMLSKIICK